jgi:antitoxin CcdA
MIQLFDEQAPKKPANLSINSDLLAKARALNINLSATLEKALTQQLKQKRRELWRQQNAKAIKASNSFVKSHGIFSDELRSF